MSKIISFSKSGCPRQQLLADLVEDAIQEACGRMHITCEDIYGCLARMQMEYFQWALENESID